MAAQREGVENACGVDFPNRVCVEVYERTESDLLANLAEWVIDRPLRIILIITLATILTKVARRSISKLSDRIIATPKDPRFAQLRRRSTNQPEDALAMAKRAPARAEAIEAVLKSTVSVVVWTLAVLLMLGELNINIAPLIAGAGIAGIALGFGAQSMVKDFLAGLFILVEDQYGVGDVIEVGAVIGTVESISLRATRVRDVQGTVWHIANGETTHIGNHSQLWSNCVIDVDIAYDTDVRKAMAVLDEVADSMWRESTGGEAGVIIADPIVQGVQALGESAVTLRLVVKTDPLSQWQVQRELRLRIKEAFDENGITIPFPQRTVRVVNESGALGDPEIGAAGGA
jgi:small conductance mechanosensitive channel